MRRWDALRQRHHDRGHIHGIHNPESICGPCSQLCVKNEKLFKVTGTVKTKVLVSQKQQQQQQQRPFNGL